MIRWPMTKNKVTTLILTVGLMLVYGYFFFSKKKVISQNTNRHPIETYLETFPDTLELSSGRKVFVVSNTNSCNSCLANVREIALNSINPDLMLIYSVENPGMLDNNLVQPHAAANAQSYFDYEQIPFRRGLVSNNPVVYFLVDGKMIDSVQIMPGNLLEVQGLIGRYLNQSSQ